MRGFVKLCWRLEYSLVLSLPCCSISIRIKRKELMHKESLCIRILLSPMIGAKYTYFCDCIERNDEDHQDAVQNSYVNH